MWQHEDDGDTPGRAGASGRPGPYGLPAGVYGRLWTAEDVASVVQVGVARARELLAEPGAPPPITRGERLVRWNGLAVVAWLHGDDWRQVLLPVAGDDSPAAGPASYRWVATEDDLPVPVAAPGRLISQPASRRRTVARPAAGGEPG